jgi:fused signal recognition particle receptor
MREWSDLFVGIDASPNGGAGTAASVPQDETAGGRRGWLRRFRESLTASRQAMVQQIATVVFDPADPETWERIEEGLIAADVGVTSTVAIVERLEGEAAAGRLTTGPQLADALRTIGAELMRTERIGSIDITHGPAVLLMVGVNGTGKTTTIGKLASRLGAHGRKVVIGAADTFRAAAAEQLEVWAQRAGAQFVRTREGGDPAAVAFDAVKLATETGADVVLIDTAGRLHTKVNLMQELEKIRRVLEKQLPGAPHEVLLSIDATTGQNGMIQAREFASIVDVTGVVLTKLDGSAKGGIGVAIANELDIPIKLVGIGEGIEDLQPFDADDFLAALFPDDLLG